MPTTINANYNAVIYMLINHYKTNPQSTNLIGIYPKRMLGPIHIVIDTLLYIILVVD